MSDSMREDLRAYYKSTDAPVDEDAKAHVIALVSGQAARCSVVGQARAMPYWRFLAGQLRFVSPRAWVAQLTLLVGMLLLVSACSESDATMLIVMVASVLSVALAVPSVFKSFESGMAELEAACRHDATQVLVGRLILFGLADVLWMSLAACLVPAIADSDPFRVFLYAATPFFSFCAACLYLSRITRGRCVTACIAAASCTVAGIWGASTAFPHWYSDASMVVWSASLVVALALALYEARRLVAQVASGSIFRTALPTRG